MIREKSKTKEMTRKNAGVMLQIYREIRVQSSGIRATIIKRNGRKESGLILTGRNRILLI